MSKSGVLKVFSSTSDITEYFQAEKPDLSIIPQISILQHGNSFNLELSQIEAFIQQTETTHDFEWNPDFQRTFVWSQEQQIRYLEWFVRGGSSGRDIYLNCVGYSVPANRAANQRGVMEIVDGKQRLNALLAFIRDEFPLFGHRYSSYVAHGGARTRASSLLNIHIMEVSKREELIKWYLLLNTGGTPHSQADIEHTLSVLAYERARNR